MGREFRAVWIATVGNIDWPTSSHDTPEKQKSDAVAILDNLQRHNFNAIVLQVRDHGDAFYNSSIEPWSRYLTGHQGTAPSPYYDPLEFFITEAHRRSIEVHAWFNPYIGGHPGQYFAPNHMVKQFPQYAYHFGTFLWMDPGAKEVQDRVYDVIIDVVTRYDVDGVHMDDFFYPYPQTGVHFPDNSTYNRYTASGGNMSLADWRRDNINKVILRLGTGIKATKSHVLFGISPFGIWKAGDPPGVQGLSSYDAIYCDSRRWIDKGWLDYLAPQLYWKIDSHQNYTALLNWWVHQNAHAHHIYAGIGVYRVKTKDWPVSEIENQITISRNLGNEMSCGNIFFSVKYFAHNDKGIDDILKSKFYKTPALQPINSWIKAPPVAPPTGLKAIENGFLWVADKTGHVVKWAVYKKIGNQWTLEQTLPGFAVIAGGKSGSYALSAVNRFHIESAKAFIDIPGNPGIIG